MQQNKERAAGETPHSKETTEGDIPELEKRSKPGATTQGRTEVEME